MIEGARASGGEPPYPAERIAGYVIAVLFLITLFSMLDRQLPALLVAPIKAEFAITDTQFGMLQGLAFASVYTLLGLPFGRLVDRANRRNLIIIGVLVWSAMTVAAAATTSYTGFFLARMGVGVGEAVLAPAAYSIIADYVRPERRGRAIGVYYLSLAVGQGASLILGGAILRLVPEGGAALPLVGLVEPWRMAFVIAGAPGALLAILLLTVREPVRRDLGASGGKAQGSIGEVLDYVATRWRAFLPILLCPAMMNLIGYGEAAWGPAFFARRFDVPPATSGTVLGVVIATVGVIGSLSAGWLGDRWTTRGVPAARLRVMLLGWGLALPSSALWTLAPAFWMSVGLVGVSIMGLVVGLASAPAMVQDIAPNRMRGQVIAGYLLVAGLFGIAVAPMLVGLLTDHLFRDEAAVGASLALIGGPVALVGLVICLLSLRAYAQTCAAFTAAAGEARTS